jgi:hypothetical protein
MHISPSCVSQEESVVVRAIIKTIIFATEDYDTPYEIDKYIHGGKLICLHRDKSYQGLKRKIDY